MNTVLEIPRFFECDAVITAFSLFLLKKTGNLQILSQKKSKKTNNVLEFRVACVL
jgi:hypothetical protein